MANRANASIEVDKPTTGVGYADSDNDPWPGAEEQVMALVKYSTSGDPKTTEWRTNIALDAADPQFPP